KAGGNLREWRPQPTATAGVFFQLGRLSKSPIPRLRWISQVIVIEKLRNQFFSNNLLHNHPDQSGSRDPAFLCGSLQILDFQRNNDILDGHRFAPMAPPQSFWWPGSMLRIRPLRSVFVQKVAWGEGRVGEPLDAAHARLHADLA